MGRERIANGAAAVITLALLASLAIPELPGDPAGAPAECWGDPADPKAPVALFENEPGPNRMERLRARLVGCGWDPSRVFIEEIALPSPLAAECIEDIAEVVDDRIDAILAQTGASRVDAVGYSLQAMTLRYYLSALGGAAKVRRAVLWGAPNNGSDKIAESPFCYFNELAKNHPFIACLNGEGLNEPTCLNPYTTATPHGISVSTPAESGVLYVNYYSDEDLLILPGEGILQDTAYNIEVPMVPHGQYPDDEGILSSTVAALTGEVIDPPKNDPAASCAAVSVDAGRPPAGAAWLAAALGVLAAAGAHRRGR